jgi:hypothetical protein
MKRRCGNDESAFVVPPSGGGCGSRLKAELQTPFMTRGMSGMKKGVSIFWYMD